VEAVGDFAVCSNRGVLAFLMSMEMSTGWEGGIASWTLNGKSSLMTFGVTLERVFSMKFPFAAFKCTFVFGWVVDFHVSN
jgi:hypothetical protein